MKVYVIGVGLICGSKAMWTPIFKQNEKQVIKSLDEYIANLSQFKNLLENENHDQIFREMENTNRIKEILVIRQ